MGCKQTLGWIAVALAVAIPLAWGIDARTGSAEAALRGTEAAAEKGDKRPHLDAFKALAGQWVRVGEDGKPTDQVMTEFRVTAGGSAVLETIMPGSEHEMITLYYMDGKDLMLTHYCVMKNQPTMKARGGENGDIHFDFVRGTNMKESDPHMHSATYHFVDLNHFRAQWHSYAAGEKTYTAEFDVVRRKKKAGSGESL